MSAKQELRSWLEKPEKFSECLNLAIKAWSSIDLTFVGKYEVILDYFNSNAQKRVEATAPDDLMDLFNVIRDFVALAYPLASVSMRLKADLIETVLGITSDESLDQGGSFRTVLLALLEHPQLVKFFNTHSRLYGRLLTRLFQCHCRIGTVSESDSLERKKLMSNLREFSQFNMVIANYKDVFLEEIYKGLTEFVILSQSQGDASSVKEYFNILNMVLFHPDSADAFKDFFTADPREEKALFKHSQDDEHILLMTLEGFVVAYINHKELLGQFLEFVTTEYKQFNCLYHVVHILSKYSVNLNVKLANGSPLMALVETMVLNFIENNEKEHPLAVLSLICETIRFNPLILEHKAIALIIKFMFVKKDTDTLQKYADFVILTMNTYMKLSRFEKLIFKIMESVKTELDNVVVSKKLKRKLLEDLESSKVQILDDSTVLPVPRKDRGGSDDNNKFLDSIRSRYEQGEEHTQFMDANWRDLVFAWPRCVSEKYIRCISSLVSPTSFAVWRSLLFNLAESLKILESRSFDDNSKFYVQFICHLFCEYLSGCRIGDQADQNFSKIREMCGQTKDFLKTFSTVILQTEHDPTITSSFLNVCLRLGAFELTQWYYRPDFIKDSPDEADDTINLSKNVKNLYKYVTKEEWALIEQRVIDFDQANCKSKVNVLNLQKLKGIQLFDGSPKLKSKDQSAVLDDVEQIKTLFADKLTTTWFLEQLPRDHKKQLIETIFDSTEDWSWKTHTLQTVQENAELIEILSIYCFKKIASLMTSKKTLICALNLDTVLKKTDFDVAPVIDKIEGMKKVSDTYDATEEGECYFDLLKTLPLAFLNGEAKDILYILHMLLIANLSEHAGHVDGLCKTLRAMNELGPRFDCLKYFDLKLQLKLLPENAHDIAFNSITNFLNEKNGNLLKSFIEDLEEDDELIMFIAEKLSVAKKNNKHEKEMKVIRMVVANRVFKAFEQNPNNANKAGFYAALSMYFQDKEEKSKDNESLGKLCLSVAVRDDFNNDAIQLQLITLAMARQEPLKIKFRDFESVVDRFWVNIIKTEDPEELATKTFHNSIEIISAYEETDKYLKVMAELLQLTEAEKDIGKLSKFCKLLQIFACCNTSVGKGVIFSEYCNKIMNTIVCRAVLTQADVYQHPELVLDILKCYSNITKNNRMMMSDRLMSDILAFPLDLNLKRLKVTNTNVDLFWSVHQEVTALCHNIVQYRWTSVRFVMPQFVNILKDLVHTICAFRNDRNGERQLLADLELIKLAKLAHRLEQVFDAIAAKRKGPLKVAPTLLVYIINEMIFNANSTTLYPTIKTHINNICYKLIEVCDSKYSQFVMRSCSEASRDVYQKLVQEYGKYYKFYGKV